MKKTKYFVYFILVLFLQNCVDIPDEVALPEYDVNFTIPIADRTYTLEEAIEDDTTNIRWSKDPSDFGILYLTDEIEIEKIDVNSNLKADPFTTSSSNLIGPMKLSNVSPVETEISYSDWGLTVNQGNSIFPHFRKDVSSDFSLIVDFASATFDLSSDPNDNILNLLFTNTYPVELKLNGLRIENKYNGVIAETSNVIIIPTGQSESLSFSVSEKTVTETILFFSNMETDGSNSPVSITNNDKLNIVAGFSPKLIFNKADAKLPAQDPVTAISSFGVDDSTELTSATIKNGLFNFRFENTLDVDVNLDITIMSLKNASGEIYSESRVLKRKDVTNLTENNLSNWRIIPNAQGQIEYSYTYSTEATDDYREVNKNQGVLVDANFSELTFSEIAGKLKPIKFAFDDRTTKLDLGEFKDKLTYDNINVEQAEIKLKLNTSANVELQLDGSVNVEYPNGETRSEDFTAKVPSPTMPTINFANLINNTSGKLPDEFILKGDAIVNPDYKNNVSVTETDTVGGKAIIEIPLNAQIVGGSIIDTIEIDETDISDEDADRLNSAELTIDITNKIAAGGSFSGVLLDEAGQKLMDIPPRDVLYNGETSRLIKLAAPETDGNGEVTTPGYTSQKIQIIGEDVKKFIKGRKLILTITFATASPTRTVKFRYTDEIIVKVSAEASIKVSE